MPTKKVHRIFISATGQNNGKTVVSLGLIYALREYYAKIGFIKPVGQRYVVAEGEKVDEDSILIEKSCHIGCAMKDMSPVAVERGFTKDYILKSRKESLVRQIKDSFRTIAKDKDLVIIEGTGHAGVGSVFDLSNATVARMLHSKVIIVSSGGIGKPIDEIALNQALFEKEKVQIAGVIVNKVRAEKYDKVNRMVRLGLEKKGLRVLGVIPYQGILSEPSVRQVYEELDFQLLSGRDSALERKIGNILVGAMAPHNALNYFTNKSLIITPGDREDMILSVIGFQMDNAGEGIEISGIVLTGGIKPHETVMQLAERVNIPLLLAPGDTYSVASSVHDLTIKIEPGDQEKERIIKDLIVKYVDIKALSKALG